MVPYKQFFKAYTKDSDSESDFNQEEKERAKICRRYLKDIADSLNKGRFTVRQIFQVDNQDLLYPTEFIDGLR